MFTKHTKIGFGVMEQISSRTVMNRRRRSKSHPFPLPTTHLGRWSQIPKSSQKQKPRAGASLFAQPSLDFATPHHKSTSPEKSDEDCSYVRKKPEKWVRGWGQSKIQYKLKNSRQSEKIQKRRRRSWRLKLQRHLVFLDPSDKLLYMFIYHERTEQSLSQVSWLKRPDAHALGRFLGRAPGIALSPPGALLVWLPLHLVAAWCGRGLFDWLLLRRPPIGLLSFPSLSQGVQAGGHLHPLTLGRGRSSGTWGGSAAQAGAVPCARCMSSHELNELTISFGGLNICIARDGGEAVAASDETGSLGSFSLVGAPGSGALAALAGAPSSSAGELAELGATSSALLEIPVIHAFGSAAWEAALLEATPFRGSSCVWQASGIAWRLVTCCSRWARLTVRGLGQVQAWLPAAAFGGRLRFSSPEQDLRGAEGSSWPCSWVDRSLRYVQGGRMGLRWPTARRLVASFSPERRPYPLGSQTKCFPFRSGSEALTDRSGLSMESGRKVAPFLVFFFGCHLERMAQF